MNYTIPKSRQQAIEIFDNLIYDTINPLNNDVPTKYHMFIGALTRCSYSEFKWQTIHANMINCVLCKDKKECMGDCSKNTHELFSKRWNE